MHIEHPSKIYDFIVENIQNIESELNKSSDDEKFYQAKQQVIQIIQKFRNNEINKSIEELKKNQEWDTFTIAFYGETNAGKSTIIESLRIYYQEEDKAKNQKKFQKHIIIK